MTEGLASCSEENNAPPSTLHTPCVLGNSWASIIPAGTPCTHILSSPSPISLTCTYHYPLYYPLHCLPHHPQSQTQLSHMGSGYETVPSTQYMCHLNNHKRDTVQAKTVHESIGRWGNDDDNTVFYVFSCSSSDWPSSNREELPPPPHDCSCPPSYCLVSCSDPPCSPVHSSPS